MIIYIQIYEPKALRISRLLKKKMVEINDDNWVINLLIQHTLKAFYMSSTVIGIRDTE